MKKVILIINPASGKDYPILAHANRIFSEQGIDWEPMVTKADGDAEEFATYAHKNKADAVVVYGGDGTVMEVATALYKTNTPLGIIPGGTANVVSKELFIPQDPAEALRLIGQKESQIKSIDMGKITIYEENISISKRFVLRISIGMLADMVVNTSRERKNTFGNLAYTVSALEQMPVAESIIFKVKMGRKKLELEGATLMITNAGNIGLSGIQFESHISVTDGKLDMILVKGADIPTMAQLLAGAVLGKTFPVMEHWHSNKFTIEIDKSRFLVCDDVAYKMQKAVIEVLPESLQVIVPK